MINIILDTNVIYSAAGFDGKILNLVELIIKNNNYQNYLSPKIIQEITSKLYSQKFATVSRIKYPPDKLESFIKNLIIGSMIIDPKITVDICRDPKDNMFLELASVAKADYIITGDKDLLELKKYESRVILTPNECFIIHDSI